MTRREAHTTFIMANKTLKEIFQAISENIDLGDFKIESIPDLELPENFSNDFHKKFLTIDSAKNNPDLMIHFKGKYLSSVDLKLKNGAKAMGLTDDEFTELKAQEPDTLKLADLLFDKVKTIKSIETPTDNKAFEKYKTETANQIAGLLSEKQTFEEKLNTTISESNQNWINKLKDIKINSLLASKTFDSGMDKEDAMYLTKKKIDDSDFILKMDENLAWKVLDKNNPELEAIIDGKAVTIDYVLDKFSQPYVAKNDQPPAQPVRQVAVNTADNGVDGRFIVGHPDYNKGL